MAASIQHNDELVENHEINVTPFIDVMLVLLIIFMVAAPLATVDIPIDLPASATEPQAKPDSPIYVTIKADRSLVLGDQQVTLEKLAAAMAAATDGNHEQRIFLRADKTVDYDTLMQTLEQLRAAGYLKVALVALEATKP